MIEIDRAQHQPVRPQHLLLLLGLAAGGSSLLADVLLQGTREANLTIFLGLVLLYAAASGVFLVSRRRDGHLPLFDIPVFLTALCFLRFGVVPVLALFHPELEQLGSRRVDYPQLTHTLLLFTLGMGAFWVGCHLCRRRVGETRLSEKAAEKEQNGAPLGWAVVLFAVSLAARVYITTNYGWGYGIDPNAYFENLAALQVLGNVADLGNVALIVICIEMCYNPKNQHRRILFLIILGNELFWGMLSGMKMSVFVNVLVVAAIISFKGAKVEKRWIIAVLLGFVALYPIQDRYRSLIRSGRVDARRVVALERAGNTAAAETARQEPGAGGWIRSGWLETLHRLDLLRAMSIAVSLDAWQIGRIQGDERWWMIPYYPFVPRFLWPNKPVLLRGQRLSLVLGLPATTSTAVTYPGDLYIENGVAGLLIGMLAFGISWQLISNRLAARAEKSDVFFYAGFFMFAINVFEVDAFSVWVSFIKLWAILSVMAYMIYGSRRHMDPRRSAVTETSPMVADVPASARAFSASPYQ